MNLALVLQLLERLVSDPDILNATINYRARPEIYLNNQLRGKRCLRRRVYINEIDPVPMSAIGYMDK